MLKLVVHVSSIPIWNCMEYFPHGFSRTVSPFDIDVSGIDTEEDCFGKLPKGEYEVEKFTDATGGIWYLVEGTSWGAFVETWDMDISAGYMSITEVSKGISFEDYVKANFGYPIRRTERGRLMVICLEDRRIVERIYVAETGAALSDHTLGYLPVSASVEARPYCIELRGV